MVAINSQDIKTITVTANASTGRNDLSVALSSTTKKLSVSDHFLTRMRSELKERYNFVTLSNSGDVQCDGTSAANNIFVVKNPASTAYIFPKSLRCIGVKANGQATVYAHGLFEMTTVISPSQYAKLENLGVVTVSANRVEEV